MPDRRSSRAPWLPIPAASRPVRPRPASSDRRQPPIVGNLILHLVYGGVLGSVFAIALEAGLDDTPAERENAAAAERGMAIGIVVGLLIGLVAGWLLGPQLEEVGSRTAVAVAGALIGAASGLMGGSLLGMGRVQLTATHRVATPADWRPGEDVIITTAVSDEEAAARFPGYATVKPYLRT